MALSSDSENYPVCVFSIHQIRIKHPLAEWIVFSPRKKRFFSFRTALCAGNPSLALPNRNARPFS